MNWMYTMAGMLLVGYGIWSAIQSYKIFKAGKQDRLGADGSIVAANICMIIIGGAMIYNSLKAFI